MILDNRMDNRMSAQPLFKVKLLAFQQQAMGLRSLRALIPLPSITGLWSRGGGLAQALGEEKEKLGASF